MDTFEQLHLRRFETRIYINATAFPFYPPEFHGHTESTGIGLDQTKSPPVTPRFDIFQLGLLLWILAQSWSSGQSALSLKERFYKAPIWWQGGTNTGPAALSRLPDIIPEYYREVVDACFT